LDRKDASENPTIPLVLQVSKIKDFYQGIKYHRWERKLNIKISPYSWIAHDLPQLVLLFR